MSDLQKIDDSEVLDLSSAVGIEEKAGNQICRNLATADEIQLDNKQGQQGSTSRSADIGFENPRSSYDKAHSVPAELDHDDVRTRVDYDQEKTQSPYNNQGEMDELPGSYFRKSSFEFKAQTFHSDRGTEDSTHSQESPLSAGDKNAEEIEGSSNIDRPNTSFQDKKVKNAELEKSLDEFTLSPCNGIEGETIENQTGMLSSSLRSPSSDSEGEIKNDSADVEGDSKNENYHYSRNSPTENRKLDVSHFTPHSPESHPAPEESPQHLSTNGHRSPRSPCRQKNSSSPERPDLATKISPHGHLSPSLKRPRQGSHLKDGPSMKHMSASPEPRYSPKKHRRHDRSISRSPIRRRDSTSKYGRDHRDRSRSRSPYMRGRYRSPRKRYSPRRRSPIGHHSRRPSPKRRPWSPPPNRRTGVGKPGRNLFVAGFSFLTTERDLERKFSRYGRVRDVRIVRDKRSGDSRGFGFLSLEKDEDADAAIRALDETEWNGRVILVEKSKSAR